jgi:eukaryotic-like serine/threonine-protein kinase
VAHHAIPPQATEDYRPEPAGGTTLERVRVALVAGSGPVAADDLYALLRRRLLIVSAIIAGIMLMDAGGDFVRWLTSPETNVLLRTMSLTDWLTYSWPGLQALIISSAAVVVLWRRPPATVRGLRLIELFCVGSLLLQLLASEVKPVYWATLESAAHEPLEVRMAFVMRYEFSGAYVWCVALVLYGALIPNTWRWCAVVVISMAVSPVVNFAVHAYWLRPLDHQIALEILVQTGTSNAVSAAIAIFACSRIEILRREASKARKLGQYTLKERLGAGGMGEVYRAEHVLLRRPCALKVIRPERAGDPRNLQRFEREVQVTATLTHPNTVQIYDYGHAADGTFYYVMEYLPGANLEELVKREGSVPPARVIHFLRQICGALKEAHACGLIHRDIKPGNVMVCERGGIQDVAKLLDFGLVLPPAGDTDGEKLTQDGALTGTPAYLSPEQADGQDTVDARSDIYSLGALAYFLLTGQPPFAGRSGVKMLAAHLYEAPQPISRNRPDVPADLEAVILRCLAKEPNARFPDAESLEAALSSCGAAGQWTARDAAQEAQSVTGRVAEIDGEAGRISRCT